MLTFGKLFLFSFIEKLIAGYIEMVGLGVIAFALHMGFAQSCTIMALCDLKGHNDHKR